MNDLANRIEALLKDIPVRIGYQILVYDDFDAVMRVKLTAEDVHGPFVRAEFLCVSHKWDIPGMLERVKFTAEAIAQIVKDQV